jgi:hypothetical protein
MKVTRKMLLIITASLGVLIIVYSLVSHFFGIGLSEGMEKYLFDVVIIAALACFMYNRKLAKDESVAKTAAEEAERRAAEKSESDSDSEDDPESNPDSEEDEVSDDDENLPHWQRNKSTRDIEREDD